jgi:hypothetical protein
MHVKAGMIHRRRDVAHGMTEVAKDFDGRVEGRPDFLADFEVRDHSKPCLLVIECAEEVGSLLRSLTGLCQDVQHQCRICGAARGHRGMRQP